MTRNRGRVGLGGAVLATVLLAGAVLPGDSPLLDATKRGDVAAVRSLLADGANPDVAKGDGLTPLHLAAEEGNLDIVKLLIAAHAKVDARTRIGDYAPLHLASGGAHVAVVEALLDSGADPKVVTTTTGVTPLHLAAKAIGGEATVRVLLEHGAPVNARESAAGQTALMFAASHGRAASVRELLSHGADPSIRTEVMDVLERVAIDRAAEARLRDALSEIRDGSHEGSIESLTPTEQQAAIAAQREFLHSEEKVQAVLEGFDPDDLANVRPYWATQNNGYRSDEEIVSRPITETLVAKTGGLTALHHAAREGRIEAVEALLDGGADIDQVSGDGSTPLVLALLNGRFDLALRLIERGADPNIATTTDGISPLFAVLQTQWALRFTDQPQPRAQDSQKTMHMQVVDALLAAGADPNVRLNTHLWHLEFEGKFGIDITGATPFWRAAFAQDLEAMRALAEHGADPNIPTAWPEPGMRGSRQEDGRVAEDSGLPIMPEGTPNMYPIHAAAGGGYLGLGAFQQNNVPNNFLPAVKFLVEDLGVDVNLPDSWGYTPLHYAAVRGGNDMIEYLVSRGADVHALTRLGQSVVDMTRGGRNGFFSRKPYPETEKLLLSLGSEYMCLNTHMRNNGDYCPYSGVEPFQYLKDEAEANATPP